MSDNLDEEEKAILKSFENGEWESVNDLEQEKERIKGYFLESHKQDRRDITFKIDIDLIEWLNSKSKEGEYNILINKALRAYIASLSEELDR